MNTPSLLALGALFGVVAAALSRDLLRAMKAKPRLVPIRVRTDDRRSGSGRR